MADPSLPIFASVSPPWVSSASTAFRSGRRLPGFILHGTTNSTSSAIYAIPSSTQGPNIYEGTEQAGSRRQNQFSERLTTTFSLPPLVRIISILIDAKNGLNGLANALERPAALWDAQFTGQRPIVGVGHHFVVYASPYNDSDRSGKLVESEAEVYCIKAPVLANGPTSHEFRSDFYHTVLQELRVLCHPILSQHENIVGLLGLDFQEDYDNFKVAWPVLLMEYAEYGTLDTFQQDLNLEPELIRRLLLDIALGLRALHDSNIIHGDMKSENVLICGHARRKYVAKLSDFGFALINPTLDKKHQLPGCTRLWSAPESGNLLAVEGLQRTDVFSFGLTVWRVFLNCADPFLFLDRERARVPPNLGHDEFVNQVKASQSFPDLVVLSLAQAHDETYISVVVRATLSLEPSERDLGRAISELSQDWEDPYSG
jgi:serine/threonine protein kinase